MELMNMLLYGAIIAIPLAGIGITKLFKIINDMLKIKKGFVESTLLMEGGQYRKKWIKPYSGSAEIDSNKKVDFNDGLGYIYRSGNRPMTVIREKDLSQLNLSKLDEEEKKVSAEDTSNLIIRAFQQGFIKGFKKNQMMNNFVLYTLLGVGACLVLCVLIMNTSSQILGAVSG